MSITNAAGLASRSAASSMIAWGALSTAFGGILLGLQVDANGQLCGTGYAALAIGSLLALYAGVLHVGKAVQLPRDTLGALAAFALFTGFAFIFSGVLAPGGPWMFFDVLLLAWLVAASRAREGKPGSMLSARALFLLIVLLLFRLWITYQGSEHRWQLLSVSIPVLSWIPWAWLEPIQSVSLGSFTPHELGFPPAGLDFPLTMSLWAAGFSLCAAGVLLAQHGWREHENDRIHDVIHTLALPLARMVERLIPEDDWQRLGLHGLSERRLAKRIESLVAERMARQAEFQRAYAELALLALSNPGGFEGRIHQALLSAGDRREPWAARMERAADG